MHINWEVNNVLMINVNKQIDYWQTGAEEELLNAKIMIENKRYLAGLFFCHLCIEKILKALVVKETKDHPAKTHNLKYLSEKTELILDDDQISILTELQTFQLEGRYPENFPNPNSKIANIYYQETIKLHSWLKMKL